MAEAHYYVDFRSYADDADQEKPAPPWHQALRQIKGLVVLFILSMVIAVAYPLSFEDIFRRL